jgi:diphthamide synthase (EF-2-diphthine--ammonia ligase)
MYFDSSVDFKSYETSFSEICQLLKQSNIYHIAFGDIFLEDLKLYRDKLCNTNSVTPVYPLWKKSSNEVFDYFEKNHFEAIICTANAAYFEMNDLGKSLSKNLLSKTKLPVDLCGENGEYHTFCTNTPYFKNKIEPQKGNIEIRDFNFKTENETEMQSRFYYIDLEIE